MKYRVAVFWVILSIGAFLLLNYAVWKIWTEELLTSSSGDLARLSYSTDVKSYRKMVDTLPVRHLGMHQYNGQHVDIITVGDSFSQGGGGGANRYYQDHIASINNATVLNIHPYEKRLENGVLVDAFDPVRTLVVLINSGVIDSIKPRHIILESVQRASGIRLAREIDFNETAEIDKLNSFYRKDPNSIYTAQQKLFFINNGNVKVLYNKIMRLFSNKEVGGVRREKLITGMFDCSTPDVLLYLKDDVNTIPSTSGPSISTRANENLNRLDQLLKKRGISFHFMPVVDKYDLYADYIIGNRFGRSDFFEQLRQQERKYNLIDTKMILSPLLKNGLKDVYYVDDTHWSWKASNAIFSQVKFKSE